MAGRGRIPGTAALPPLPPDIARALADAEAQPQMQVQIVEEVNYPSSNFGIQPSPFQKGGAVITFIVPCGIGAAKGIMFGFTLEAVDRYIAALQEFRAAVDAEAEEKEEE